MIPLGREIEFVDVLGRHYVISRRSLVGAVDRSRAVELVRGQLRRDPFFRSSLARWARYEGVWTIGDDDRIIYELLRNIESGMIRVHEQAASKFTYSHRIPDVYGEPEIAPGPGIDELDPEVEDDRSLRIVRCDPELGAEGPLRFEYQIRGLAGQAVELLIRSPKFPGEIVHREALTPEQTLDRIHAGTWDGVVTSSGQLQGERLPADYGPCTLEVVHDQVYRDEAQFTIHRTVVLITLDGFFHTSSAMLLPSRPARGGSVTPFEDSDDTDSWRGSEPNGELPPFDQPFYPPARFQERETVGPTLLANILAECGSPQARRRLILVGHANAAGANAFNDELGDARARCVWSLLTGDADGFEAALEEFWVLEDAYVMLRYCARMFAWDCDAGEPRSQPNAAYFHAVRCFQRSYNVRFDATIDVDGDVGPQTRGAFFAVYDQVLSGAFGGESGLAEYRGRLRVHGPSPTMSAGERFLASSMRPGAGIDDRRVEALLFLPDELVPEDAPVIYEGGSFTFVEWSLEVDAADDHGEIDPVLEPVEPSPEPSHGDELDIYDPHDLDDPWDFLNAFSSVANQPGVRRG